MMADFVVPRHSAVMERLRRRIELFRRHNTSCENRYDNTARERLEMERQQTFALHQRCLQTKAKRSSKQRQPQPTSDQAVQRGSGTGGNNADLGEGGTPEQSRNSTLIALQESVKRKLESSGSPGQVNGFSDGYPPSKKACLDNGTSNGGIPPRSPLDSKHGIAADSLIPNGGEPGGTAAGEQEFRLKEMKQEPMDDILPCMLPSGGGASNSLFPDLNFNEQEWTELMEELNRSVAYEDIQDILNDGFEDRKEPPDLSGPTPGTGAQSGGTSQGGLLLPDLASVKAEFSPASTAFEQDSCAGSPHARPKSSGPPMQHFPAAANSTASSPALPQPLSQQPPPSRQLPPQNHRLPPGPVAKDLSPAQQLQQLAAQQQRAQQMQSQLQQQQHAQKQQQQAPKFHPPGSHPCRPSWPPQSAPSQSPLGGAYRLEKPTSPSLYPQDFPNNPKPQLMMPGQPNKGSPKAVAGGYLQPGGPHTNILGHPAQGPGAPLSHPAAAGPGGLGSAMLNYSNTKPLSHYEAAAQGPPQGPPSAQSQNKAVLLSLLRQQQQMKQKQGLPFRPQLPHGQEQNAYPAAPHGPGPGNAMAPQTGGPGNGMAGNHGNVPYLSGQAAVKQQQLMEQQKQFLLGQRQQLIMAQQEKQRQQQEQQLQRHLTRPPPQYQDQQNQQPGAQNNPFQQQQQVAQFTGSSQPLSNMGSLGGPAPGAQRMFPQTQQGMMGMTMGQQGGAGPTPGVPPASSQADMSLASCVGVMDSALQHQVLYSNMNMHPSQQSSMQRQPVGNMGAPYRQNMLSQQQNLKNQPNAALLKQQQQQQLARLPGSMPGGNMPSVMPNAMQSTQSQTWQQQGMQQAMGAQQPPSSNGGLPPNAFANPNAFHMQQQAHIPNKMPVGNTPFGANANGRPMGAMNPAQQQMMQQAQQRTAANPQVSLGQPLGPGQVLPNQQQQQGSQGQGVLPDLGAFGQLQGGRSVSQGLQCRQQGYQVNRTANQQQQQQLPFGYNTGSGASSLPSFPGESDLVDSLLKERSTQEWMDDLDELLASHH